MVPARPRGGQIFENIAPVAFDKAQDFAAEGSAELNKAQIFENVPLVWFDGFHILAAEASVELDKARDFSGEGSVELNKGQDFAAEGSVELDRDQDFAGERLVLAVLVQVSRIPAVTCAENTLSDALSECNRQANLMPGGAEIGVELEMHPFIRPRTSFLEHIARNH